jgi:hypothetical protein
MADQRLLNSGIRMAAAMAFVVAVMSAPIRPVRPTPGAQPDHFRRHFVMPNGSTTHNRSHAPLHSRVIQVKALNSETKDRLSGTAVRATLLVLSPPALSSGMACQGIRVEMAREMHPLRC